MQYSKLWIEIIILIFMFTTCSLCSLFCLYYISPSNYVLYDFKESNKKTLTIEYNIETNKTKKIKECKYPNKVLRIYSNDVDYVSVTLENKFKSENLYVNKNNLIKLVNSDLIIKNNTNKPIKVILEVYSM
jgi:hypothetical protein